MDQDSKFNFKAELGGIAELIAMKKDFKRMQGRISELTEEVSGCYSGVKKLRELRID